MGNWIDSHPIVIWLLVAMANGFNFSHPWLGSKGTDLLLGLIGVVVVVIGMVLLATSADEQ